MPTLLCVPIAVHDLHAALDDVQAARDAGADLVEFRIDAWFESLLAQSADGLAAVLDLVERSELPCIVTCRPDWEGGDYAGDEDARLELIESLLAADAGPRYVDFEFAAFDRTPGLCERLGGAKRADGSGLIVSMHDFDGRPTDLSRRMAAMYGLGLGEVVKIAYRLRSVRDNLELFEIMRASPQPTIAIGMGQFGLASRVFAAKFGGFLTFASLRDNSATAPGQPTLGELKDKYRFRSIGRSTRVYGVIGWPIEHSMSPAIHNAGFEANEHDGVYLPLSVSAGDDADDAWVSFKATVAAMVGDDGFGFAGASVTLPHKENLVRLAIEQGWGIDELSQLCGAANTLSRDADGRWRVSNTDGPAAVDPLEEELGDLGGRSVVVLGAGGAARAVVCELARRGAIVTVCNRSTDRAERLAEEVCVRLRQLSGEAASVRAFAIEGVTQADALVNCTPVGMDGGPEGSPVTEERLREMAGLKVVEDTVYNPPETALVKLATNCGVRAFGGLEMFVRQAAGQHEAWVGKPGPKGLFARVVHEELIRKE